MLCAAARRRRTDVVDVGVRPRGTSVPSSELDQDRTWLVTPWQVRPQQPPLTRLTDGGITVLWSQANQAPRGLGTVSLRGHLFGTAHGTAPGNFPTTTGIVSGWSPSTTPAPMRVAGYRLPAVGKLATLLMSAEADWPCDRQSHLRYSPCYSVRMFVSVLKVLLVNMRVLMGLSVVTVLVSMLDVFMIVHGVRVRMRHVPVRVLMGVLCCGH